MQVAQQSNILAIPANLVIPAKQLGDLRELESIA